MGSSSSKNTETFGELETVVVQTNEEDDIQQTNEEAAKQFTNRVHYYIERLKRDEHKTGKGGVKYIKVLQMDSTFCSCECIPVGKRNGAYDYYSDKITMRGIDPPSLRRWLKILEDSPRIRISLGRYAGYIMRFSKEDKNGDRKLHVILEKGYDPKDIEEVL